MTPLFDPFNATDTKAFETAVITRKIKFGVEFIGFLKFGAEISFLMVIDDKIILDLQNN